MAYEYVGFLFWTWLKSSFFDFLYSLLGQKRSIEICISIYFINFVFFLVVDNWTWWWQITLDVWLFENDNHLCERKKIKHREYWTGNGPFFMVFVEMLFFLSENISHQLKLAIFIFLLSNFFKCGGQWFCNISMVS